MNNIKKYSVIWFVIFPAILLSQSYREYDVKFYHPQLHVYDTTDFISGHTRIDLETTAAVEKITFDMGDNLVIDSLSVNNIYSSFNHEDDLLTINLPQEVAAGQQLSVVIFYHGFSPEDEAGNPFNEGVISKFDKRFKQHVTYVASEPFGARYWFPCNQNLTDKADSVQVTIKTAPYLLAGSNGLLIDNRLENDQRILTWKSNYPTAYYLIFFSVSRYREYSYYIKLNDQDSLFFQNFIYDQDTVFNLYKQQIDATADMVRLFDSLLGDYPFNLEKYGHCLIDGSGTFAGMEYQTMSIVHDFDFDLVAHELAHAWFGDYVTCKSWQDIWINEGFATYLNLIAIENLISKEAAMGYYRNYHRYIMQESSRSVFLDSTQATDPGEIFNYRNSYLRGAMSIHTLRYLIQNDEVFYTILRHFLFKYGFSNASIEDFWKFSEETSSLDLDSFFEHWIYSPGHPVLFIDWVQNDNLVTFFIENHFVVDNHPEYDIEVEILVKGDQFDTLIATNKVFKADSFSIVFDGQVEEIILDPNDWIILNRGPERIMLDTANVSLPPAAGQYLGRFSVKDQESPNYYYYQCSLLSVEGAGESSCISIEHPEDNLFYNCLFDTMSPGQLSLIVEANDFNGGILSDTFDLNLFGNKYKYVDRNQEFTVFPNPAKNYLYFVSNNLEFDHLQTTVVSQSGEVMINESFNDVKPNSPYHIDITSLVKGVYVFNLRFETGDQSLKFIR